MLTMMSWRQIRSKLKLNGVRQGDAFGPYPYYATVSYLSCPDCATLMKSAIFYISCFKTLCECDKYSQRSRSNVKDTAEISKLCWNSYPWTLEDCLKVIFHTFSSQWLCWKVKDQGHVFCMVFFLLLVALRSYFCLFVGLYLSGTELKPLVGYILKESLKGKFKIKSWYYLFLFFQLHSTYSLKHTVIEKWET